MSGHLIVERAGPAVSVQDMGRTGALSIGLSRGGAADRTAYIQGLALLGAPLGTASIECAGLGGRFRFERPTRFALTGADMRATLNGAQLETQASHIAPTGSILDISAMTKGVYGYLAVAGGIETDIEFGGRGYHRIGGFGTPLNTGDRLPLSQDTAPDTPPHRLPDVIPSGPVRIMPGPQTPLFSKDVLDQFIQTTFTRSARANRQGVRLDHDGPGFATGEQLNQVSDFISEGDVQMTGDGTPYVLLADCQTIGGYPRIGTVLPADLHRIAQASAGDPLRFSFVTLVEAEAAWTSDEVTYRTQRQMMIPRVRDPHEMADLLSYELIDRPSDDVIGTG